MKSGLLGTRQFTFEDQQRFAKLSGDFNPMHVDPVAARRTIYGNVVVHGVHSLLWALDQLIETPSVLGSLKVDFKKQIRLGDLISCRSTSVDDGKHSLVLESGGEIVARITASLCFTDLVSTPFFPLTKNVKPALCRDLTFEQMATASGTLPLFLDEGTFAKSFPVLAKFLPPQQIAVILATTRLVGMECPGLHSLFSGLDLHFHKGDQSNEPELKYQVTRSDRRFSMLWIEVKSPCWNGTLTAFARPRPSAQAAMDEISRAVTSKQFADQRALIIGGSRGLGEITAKIIAAGGGEVAITYNRGKADAERVAAEITATGLKCEVLFYDVSNPEAPLATNWKPTHLYYFATPLISLEKANAFSQEKFRQYCHFYVTSFARVVETLLKQGVERLTIFYPSTIFLEKYQEHTAEYCAAKAAGETLCRHLEKQFPQLKIYSPRLPRMKTDQTSSLIPIVAGEPLEIMLKEIREMNL